MDTSLYDVMIGSCLSMCSPAERNARHNQRRLHVFEMPSDTYPNCPVKEFCRSAAGRQISPSELRPAGVLLSTMKYLMNEIVDRKDQSWIVVYHFVFDRTRAIRQDLVIQSIEDESAVEILEYTARFHIFAGFNLFETSKEHFDSHINDNHIQECLKRLLVIYSINFPDSPNRPEFESYYLLHNLGLRDAMEHSLKLPEYIKCQHIFITSWNISLMKFLGNSVGLFRLVKSCPFLASCLVQKHCPSIRHEAVAVLNTAFGNPKCQFPLEEFSNILMFNDELEAQSFLMCFGIEVNNGLIKFSKKSYVVPDKLPVRLKCKCIADKMSGTVKNVLQHGCSLQVCSTHCCMSKTKQETKEKRKEKKNEWKEQSMNFASEVSKPFIGRGRGRGLKHSNLENPKQKH